MSIEEMETTDRQVVYTLLTRKPPDSDKWVEIQWEPKYTKVDDDGRSADKAADEAGE